MNKRKVAQIIIPVLIFVMILGLWFFKNKTETQASTDIVVGISEEQKISDLPKHLQSADFSLAATEAVDFEAMAEYGIPLIVDYGADSCVPCKEMAPVLEKLNKEMYGKAFIKFVDVWQYADAASNVPVQVIPTQVFFNADGTPFVPSEELASQVPFTMYSYQDSNEHAFTVHQGGLTEEQMRLILIEMGVE